MDARTLGARLTLVGAGAQVAGLAVDVALHAADPTLAAREGVLSLGNAGHALLLAGIVLVLAGAGVALAHRVPTALAVVLAVAAVAGTMTGGRIGAGPLHDHDGEAAARAHRPAAVSPDGHSPASTPTAAPAAPPAPGIEGLDHGHADGQPDEALDPATRAALADQMVAARAVALAHPTVADAEAAGYRQVTPYVPGIGAHYLDLTRLDRRFDPGQPEMLLFDGVAPTSRIAGLSYYVRAPAAPEGFAGPNDRWHRHVGLCIDPRRILVVGGERTTAERCAALGGVKVPGVDGWMVHAWVVPGWESPLGVFSARHPGLR